MGKTLSDGTRLTRVKKKTSIGHSPFSKSFRKGNRKKPYRGQGK
jgi:hypothetical protein